MLEAQVSEAFALPSNTRLTLSEAKRRSIAFFKMLKQTEDGPKELSDYWYHLSDNWDLNIWLFVTPRRGNFHMVTLYPIDKLGNTNTQKWYEAYEERVS
jgi:hypothetical protein